MKILKAYFSRALAGFAVVIPALAAAQVPAYYYQGDRKVEVQVRTDALSVETTAPLPAAMQSRVKAAVPRPQAGSKPRKLVVETAATGNVDELSARAQEVKKAAPGATVRPLMRPAGAEDDASDQVLTQQISFKLKENPPPGALNALAKRYGMSDVKPVEFAPGAYTATINGKTTDLLAPLKAANALQESGEVDWAAPQVEKQQFKRVVPNDPFFPHQWHLQNNGTNTTEGLAGIDMNVVPAWAHATGAGINIAISDDGVDTSHTDLLPNVRLDLDYDFNGNDTDPRPGFSFEYHGTGCAGVAAGKGNNGVGIAGVAPDAGIVGLRLIANFVTDPVEATAMAWKMTESDAINQVAVNSNSWGPLDNGKMVEGPGPLTEAALLAGVTLGRSGKGIVYPWAAGNGRSTNDNINRDGYANSPYVIAVGATNSSGTLSWYSERGAPLLINAPSNHSADGIFTTDIAGLSGENRTDYRNNFGGTSSAAPAVAGMIALMLEANPELTYRDVMHILVDTAVKNDPDSSSWKANGSGRLFSHDYGYGRVDAGAAVVAALGWQNVPSAAMPIEVSDSLTTSLAIPDGDTSGVMVEIPVNAGGGFFTEHVELQADISHTWRGDLRIELVSPSGMVSELMTHSFVDSADNFSNWRFRSVAHWGESPNGTWKLRIADMGLSDVGAVNSFTLRIRGHELTQTGVEDWRTYE